MTHVTLQFQRNDSHPEGEKQSKIYGPYEWFQVTYGTIRAGENGEIEIAKIGRDGFWGTGDTTWSDFIISAVD